MRNVAWYIGIGTSAIGILHSSGLIKRYSQIPGHMNNTASETETLHIAMWFSLGLSLGEVRLELIMR